MLPVFDRHLDQVGEMVDQCREARDTSITNVCLDRLVNRPFCVDQVVAQEQTTRLALVWVTMTRDDCNWRSPRLVRLIDVMVGLWSFSFRVAPSHNPGKNHPRHPSFPQFHTYPPVKTQHFPLGGLVRL
jgi:hypothetical protein